ncbi:multidrug transporter [Pseudomonas sp. 5P_3.1_Bac2]|uniref:multidrug transporter n=1 Tax=Pseudomonas sp. 5P_3.1_Bac2 TaxID=2971617 RepID=UPI0021C87157|nr:multidrug transporter [Pseudomonas sp. 5P_3.1_Bac2]MCU1715754.1 multidrug transporter [Pseudomonas sp. 5P_3.1_Bac2]
MLLGALLLLSWLVLLLRYPRKALPISGAAAVLLGLLASVVLWQERRDEHHLARLQLHLSFAPGQCPADQPLALTLDNRSSAALVELTWQVAAYRPGENVNLAQAFYTSPHYSGPGELAPGAQWRSCLPVPTLRSGYRASTLEFRAERLQGRFNY